ncbi:MAG: LamG-like jellyroll fold domain-containing protein, partial [Candidatus Acidiferrales bacterium]
MINGSGGGSGGGPGTLPSLVGYWTFSEGSGTTTADSSGNGHIATLSNGISWTTGKVGGAISANGTNQYGTISSINLTSTSAVSVAAWVNRTYTSAAGTVLFEFSSNFNATNNAFGFFSEGAADCGKAAVEMSLQGNNGYDVKCYTQPSSGVWHHIAAVYDMSQASSNSIAFYVDGILQTSFSQPYSSNNTNTFGNYPLYLFSRAGTVGFSSGEISDLQIYNRALSASDVQQLYNGPSADFMLTALPSSQTIFQGSGTPYTATLTELNGFTGSIAMSVGGLPTGATAAFNPASVLSSGTSTLSVTTASNTPVGSYPLTITSTNGGLTHSAIVTLVVNTAVTPDFAVSVAPGTQTVAAGSSAVYTTTITNSGGFNDEVDLSISGLPTGATASFNPAFVTGSGSSTLTVSTSSNTPIGSSTLTIIGTSGSLTHSASTILVVSAPPDFSLNSSPSSQSVIQGSSTNYLQTVTGSGGFTGTVTFSVTGLPTGATGTFNPTSVTTSGTSTLTVSTTGTTPAGTYPLTIKGTSGNLVHTSSATLIVTNFVAPTLVSIAVTPANPSIAVGATQQ